MIKTCSKLMILGDFSCKEVNWEDWKTSGRDEAWGNVLLMLKMYNTMTQ